MEVLRIMLKGILVSIFAIAATTVIAISPAFSLSLGGVLYPEQEEEFTIRGIPVILRFQADGNLVVYNKESFYGGIGAPTAYGLLALMEDRLNMSLIDKDRFSLLIEAELFTGFPLVKVHKFV